MDARMLICAMAVLAGFAAIYATAYLTATALRRRNVAMAAQGDPNSIRGVIAWRLRNGYGFLLPVARALLRLRRVGMFANEVVEVASSFGMASTPVAALSVLLLFVGAVGLAVGVVTGSVVGALACAACTACFLVVLAGNAQDKRQEQVREAVPEALESMADCFGSGFTLLQTFRQVADDTSGALGNTFAQSAHVLEMGGSAEEALEGLREGAHASELAFVAVALDVQHQSGGAMRQVLDAATDTVKGELALRRSLRVQTAQAKLSARVVPPTVSGLPWVAV